MKKRHPIVEKWLRGGNDGGGCIADLEREVKRLRSGIESLRRKWHDECEDAWYSCAQHPDCADDRRRGGPCDCGVDAFNAKLDALLKTSHPKRPSAE